ncbi:hypothetical protein [Amycolatopsis echigonensis]
MGTGRPRAELGYVSEISYRKIREDPELWEARVRIRLRNGRYARPSARGATERAARNALKKRITKIADRVVGSILSSESRFGLVMDKWLAEFKKKVDRSERAEKSYYDYRDTVAQLKDRMGELACWEAENPGLCDEVLKSIREEAAKSKRSKGDGYAAAKRARTVLSNVCGYAMRHNAMWTAPG